MLTENYESARFLNFTENVKTPALRREPTTPPNSDISPLTLYNPFLCCTPYNRSRTTLQPRPRYCRTNRFTKPVDSFFSKQDDLMLSDPKEILCRNASEQLFESHQNHPWHEFSFNAWLVCVYQFLSNWNWWAPYWTNVIWRKHWTVARSFCLTVKKFKQLLGNIQSEFSFSDGCSKEFLRLLSVTLSPKNNLPRLWRFLEDQKH